MHVTHPGSRRLSSPAARAVYVITGVTPGERAGTQETEMTAVIVVLLVKAKDRNEVSSVRTGKGDIRSWHT